MRKIFSIYCKNVLDFSVSLCYYTFMGVTTTADEKLKEAKEAVQEAINNLVQIALTREVWGCQEYTQEYIKKMLDSIDRLCEVRELLGE